VLFNKPRASSAQDQSTAVPVRRFPTRLHLRCSGCRRQSVKAIFLIDVPKLRCRECGARNPVVLSRDGLQAWSARRRGR
jgi:hypothetical protein